MAAAVQTLVLKKFFHWTEIVSFREGEQKTQPSGENTADLGVQ